MDDSILELCCWIRSEQLRTTFQVEIPKTAKFYDLQKAVKNNNPACFHTVDAGDLNLYRPNDRVFCEENLRKLNLSEHAKVMWGGRLLSEEFPKQPPGGDIHIIVGERVHEFQTKIWKDPHLSARIASHPIRLYKVSGNDDELRECLGKVGVGEQLCTGYLVSYFLDMPVLDPLNVVIETFIATVQEPIPYANTMPEYWDILLKVARDIDIPDIPVFVTAFEQKLLQKPCLPQGAPASIPEQYFKPFQDSIAKDPQEEIRHADLLEVAHTAYHIVHYDWHLSWLCEALNEPIMASLFFDPFRYAKSAQNTILGDKSWPFYVAVKRDDESDTELRKYRLQSDFLIINSALPRLLVQVNSMPSSPFPGDQVQMIVTGAFVVRFANNFVTTFNREKNFVLCTFYIRANGIATRYILFQIPNDSNVYYRKKNFQLNDPLGRVEFVRHLYNLRSESEQGEDQATKDAIMKLNNKVQANVKRLMFTETPTDRVKMRPRTDSDSNHHDSAGHTTQLGAHGYEVEPQVFVDDSGGKWEPLYEMPDHILTVYRPTNPDEVFIAKKVRKESNELEILKLLNTTRPKSDHVISLVDSFDGWAILPKMATVAGYLDSRPKVLESKVPQVCLGLIKGLAYLHELRIAHRDIKPDNLVVDKNFTLQIIDFDRAMQVKDEDQMVDDPCGTDGWIAPEIDESWYSPIKADRWSCGWVLLFLLDRFGKEDVSLRAFARDLIAHDPNQRPPLHQWVAPLLSDCGNTGNFDASEASRFRRDREEDDGETTTSPDMKKRRLR